MKKYLMWLWMLCKRLYKKPSFLVILLLIPVAVLSLKMVAKEDSGFLTVVLAEQNPEDPISSEITSSLLAEESLIRFVVAKPTEGISMVHTGEADAVWIFPDQMKEKTDAFAENVDPSFAFVSVVEREDTVFLRLAREKLTGALFPYACRAYYVNFARTNLSHLDSMSEEELLSFYDGIRLDQTLFTFDSAEPNAAPSAEEGNYLTSPVRGLLAVLVCLGSFAAALFYLQDEKRGTFFQVPQTKIDFVAFACLFIAVFNLALVALVSLVLSGMAVFSLREFFAVILYAVCCSAFGLALLRLIRSIRILASIIPMLITLMIVVCPIFFDFRALLGVQLLFPPTYYVNAAYDKRFFLWMLLYSAVCLILAFLFQKAHGFLIRHTAAPKKKEHQ